MPPAPEIEPVCRGILLWRFYDPEIKADLFSTAVDTAAGLYLIDPIPLAPAALDDLASRNKVAGIIVTNENHERAAAWFAERFQVPIYLDAPLASVTELPGAVSIRENCFPAEMTVLHIDGGPGGELAIHFAGGGGAIVVGDALINFEPYGFALLPAKYCRNFKKMRHSLMKLLEYSFDRMLFGHGLPIQSHARQRLDDLLKEHP